MSTAIIVGTGPAGISAALYLKRANIDVTLIGKRGGALEKADSVENYFGFAEPVSGKDLAEAGMSNALRLGCRIVEDEVVSIGYNQSLTVFTKGGSYEGDVVVLATGAARNTPNIEGVRELEGKGVSYCAVCDAFFYRKKDVAVLGSGEYALHEATELAAVASSVTV
ncbi:MAG: NAD(P)/FAD-dependent oxidoreductase, partial [Bacillota bacterium]|nr:NAD(P)/FAD-dependent oxidoreductase [Bacillota bacterium]